MVTLGVLALQGGVREHVNLLQNLKVLAKAVKSEQDLDEIDGLIIPGGESTTISKLLDIFHLKAPILKLIETGLPVLGTCAGLILLSEQVDNKGGFFQVMPCSIKRNAYGTQLASGEAVVSYDDGSKENAAFIRAPKILDHGKATPVAWVGDEVVAIKHENIIGASYHPELTNSTMLHRKLIELIKAN